MKEFILFVVYLVLFRIFDLFDREKERNPFEPTDCYSDDVPIGEPYRWIMVQNDMGDRDVLPIGEEDNHSRGPGCVCDPKVDLVGAYVLTVHNSFDHREIIEQALEILRGEENETR